MSLRHAAGSPDVLVVGAGVMGAWSAFLAQRAGLRTTLVDAYGAGNPRATSSDVSRTIRSAHGTDTFYARWARESGDLWRRFGQEWDVDLFVGCGTLWFARDEDGFEAASEATLHGLAIRTEHLAAAEMEARWPGLSAEGLAFALFEPDGGLLRAKAGVEAVARAFEREGGRSAVTVVRPGAADGDKLLDVVAGDGSRHTADSFVFACGPWLPRLFPDVVGPIMRVTKQDVIFLGSPGGDTRFTAARFPTWVEYGSAMWGLPDVDGHGFKVGPDRSGPIFDPSNGERVVDAESVRLVRGYVARRFPTLATAPIVETRVCQYEATLDTQFILDRHPAFSNVWLVGGGSGHGFKHGPRIGQTVTARLLGEPPGPGEERFSVTAPRTGKGGLRAGGDAAAADWQAY
jgi:glycine/D-amino acid oxidase-like deaminating enzyme